MTFMHIYNTIGTCCDVDAMCKSNLEVPTSRRIKSVGMDDIGFPLAVWCRDQTAKSQHFPQTNW